MANLIPIHTCVKGRARLAVPGLKNSLKYRRRLMDDLPALTGILRLTASTCTGRILVWYDPALLTVNSLMNQIGPVVDRIGQDLFPARRTDTNPPNADGCFTSKTVNNAVRSIDPIDGKRVDAVDDRWHTRPGRDVTNHFGTDMTQGLTHSQVAAFRDMYGDNVLPKAQCRKPWQIFLSQMNSLPVYLLGAVAGVSVVMGGILDAVIVSGVVLANAVIGYVTERKAEKNINALNGMAHPMAEVVRDGRSLFVPAEEVVSGDLLILKPGSFVAADCRIIKSSQLTIDESMLTGESLPVEKDAAPIAGHDLPLGDRKNMSYMGTCITGGQGMAVAVATGRNTRIGRLQTLLNETRSLRSPIERQLDQIGDLLIFGCLAICGGVFALGLLMGFGMLSMLRMSISLAAAAVPEGLPSIATINFAIGINRMKKNDVLVRRLPAAETLGAIQTICLDKTGTITMNQMKAVSVYLGQTWFSVEKGRLISPAGTVMPCDDSDAERLYAACALCCETKINGRCTDGRLDISGSATESALTELVDHAGINVTSMRNNAPLLQINHRSEQRLFMSTVHAVPGTAQYLVMVKGSPLEILSRCDACIADGRKIPLTREIRTDIESANETMADNALRVLGFASRSVTGALSDHMETGLTWLGLIGLADPPREGIDTLIARFHRAGIRTVMITGDQQISARAVARQLNLSGGETLAVMDAVELAGLDDKTLVEKARSVHVYSRVTPSQKLKIVRAIQAGGQTVAMTGDGINDGPALKAADIGIAMGDGGTDLARDVADVVLTRDSLALLAESLADGRSIYQNIRKSVHYSLATNISEIQLTTMAIAMGLGSPLTVMQLLWINMISDILPGLALSLEDPEGDVMEMPPRQGDAALFSQRDFSTMFLESSSITGGALGAMIYGLSRYGSPIKAGGFAFHSLAVGQLLHAVTCRSETAGALTHKQLKPNQYLNWAIGLSIVAQALTLFIPPLRRLLGLSRIGLMDGLVVSTGATLPLLINETIKALRERQAPDSGNSFRDKDSSLLDDEGRPLYDPMPNPTEEAVPETWSQDMSEVGCRHACAPCH